MTDRGSGGPSLLADMVVAGAELLVTMDDEGHELRGGWVAIERGPDQRRRSRA